MSASDSGGGASTAPTQSSTARQWFLLVAFLFVVACALQIPRPMDGIVCWWAEDLALGLPGDEDPDCEVRLLDRNVMPVDGTGIVQVRV